MSQTDKEHSRLYRNCIFTSSLFSNQESVVIAVAGLDGIRFFDSNFELRKTISCFGAVGRVAVGPDDIIIFTGRQQTRSQTFPDGTDFSLLDPTGVVGVPFEKDDMNLNHGPRCVRFAKLTRDGDITGDLAELCFRTNVCGLCTNKAGFLSVVLETETLVYNIKEVIETSEMQRAEEEKRHARRRQQTNVAPKMKIDTGLNFRGAVAMTKAGKEKDDILVAVPGLEAGRVIIANIKDGTKNDYKFMGHQLAVAEFSPDGRWLFVISELGKYCYVISVKEGLHVKTLIRGSTAAIPYRPCVSDGERFVVTSSVNGTRHVYVLDKEELKTSLKEKKASKETSRKQTSSSGSSTSNPNFTEADGEQALGNMKIDEEDDVEDEGLSDGDVEQKEEVDSGSTAEATGTQKVIGFIWKWTKAGFDAGVSAAKKTYKAVSEMVMKNYNFELKEDAGVGTYLVCGFGSSGSLFVASSDGHLLKYTCETERAIHDKTVIV